MTEVFIGRQPIFDRELKVVGYELLYRGGDVENALFSDPNHATSVVLSNTFLEMGLERLVDDKLAFINLTRAFLLGEYPLPMRHDRLVLEVLEDIVIDAELIQALEHLSAQGFKLALDDVVDPDAVANILHLAQIVKVDLMQTDFNTLPEHVTRYQTHQVELLAEKVETQAEFEQCKSLGFDYFQGYFLCRPSVLKEKKISGLKMVMLSLLSKLQSPEIEFAEIEDIIRQDVTLSYKLLRLINSAFYTTRSEIKSIRQALTLLGLSQIRAWVSLLLLSESDNKPQELIKTAMIRGKMCEHLAGVIRDARPDVYFTVGLFSVLEALMDLPLKDILAQISLAEDINLALLEQRGELGQALSCVLAYEQGQWEEVHFHGLQPESIIDCYLQALAWADQATQVLATH